MVNYEGAVRRHLEEFVGSGYENSDMFLAAKLYQKIQLDLHKLASKLDNCGNEEHAKSILDMSESLHEIYADAELSNKKCEKE